MKATLILLTALFLLIGCTQTNNNISANKPATNETTISTYNNEEFNISFNYPSDWTIKENDTDKTVTVASPPDMENAGNLITIKIPSESFEEYEETNKDLLAEDRMSINSLSKLETDLPTKIYGQHGWLYQIIEVNGKHISAGNETEFSKKEKEGLKEILNSLSL